LIKIQIDAHEGSMAAKSWDRAIGEMLRRFLGLLLPLALKAACFFRYRVDARPMMRFLASRCRANGGAHCRTDSGTYAHATRTSHRCFTDACVTMHALKGHSLWVWRGATTAMSAT